MEYAIYFAGIRVTGGFQTKKEAEQWLKGFKNYARVDEDRRQEVD